MICPDSCSQCTLNKCILQQSSHIKDLSMSSLLSRGAYGVRAAQTFLMARDFPAWERIP